MLRLEIFYFDGQYLIDRSILYRITAKTERRYLYMNHSIKNSVQLISQKIEKKTVEKKLVKGK